MVAYMLGEKFGYYPDSALRLKYDIVIASRLKLLKFSKLREYSCPTNGPVLDAIRSKVGNNIRRWLKGMTSPLCRPAKFVLDIKLASFTLVS